MEFENSALYREVESIIGAKQNTVGWLWQADVHTPEGTYRALKVLSIDFNADYEGNYADEVMVVLALSGGTYAKRIYPFQSQLELTLYRTPLVNTRTTTDENAKPQSERYAATLLDKGDLMLEGNAGNLPTEDVLNQTSILDVEFQLVNKALEQLRMLAVGGVYRYTTVEDVIKTVLTNGSQQVVVEGVRMPQGVDMVPASNTQKRDHIVIPHGVTLVKIPQYIHDKCGGVYSSGMGYYLQGDYWYVYPCFDVTRFEKAQRTLTVINVPKNKFPGVESTYRQDGRNTVVLATGEVRFIDDSDQQQLNAGNGVRFADATKFMEGFSETKKNVTQISRGANASEFVSSKRANGNQNVQLSSNPITANPYAEYSKLARREGSFITLIWENSSISVIFPGMMVKILYLREGRIEEVYGVMLKAHHFVQASAPGLVSSGHYTTTSFTVFVKKPATNE